MATASTGRRSVVGRVGVVPLGCVIGLVMIVSIAAITWRTSPTLGRKAAVHASASRNIGQIPVAAQSSTGGYVSTGKAKAVSPTRIEIPKLHASAPIVSVATTPDGELDVPSNPQTVGWWSPGAKPGAKKGTAILAGHINYNGVTGTLADIGELNPGDTVRIYGKYNAGKKHVDSFTVAAVRTYHKTSLPYAEIFDQKSLGRLAIVTCGGPFDASTGNYLDNIVVFAVPA